MAHKVKVLENQTIYDIAMQEYGNWDGIYKITSDNPGLDLDIDLVAGSLIIINSDPIDRDVVNALKEQAITPATKS